MAGPTIVFIQSAITRVRQSLYSRLPQAKSSEVMSLRIGIRSLNMSEMRPQ
jgi:hypothetical protein